MGREPGKAPPVNLYPPTLTEKKVLTYLRKVHRSQGFKKREGLFEGLPRDMRWVINQGMTEKGLTELRLIGNEPNWLALGGFLREPAVAADWALRHPELKDCIRNYNERMWRGEKPPPVVIVGPNSRRRYWNEWTILDGNHRVVAMLLGGGLPIETYDFIMGTSDHIEQWKYYRDSSKFREKLTHLELDW